MEASEFYKNQSQLKTLSKFRWVPNTDTANIDIPVDSTQTIEPKGYWVDQGNRKERRFKAKKAR